MRIARAAAGVVLALCLVALVAGCGLGGSGDAERQDGPGATADETLHKVEGTELYRGDWETGDMSQWDGVQAVADDRIQIVTDPVDQGEYAARFEVRDGDNPIGFGDRAEVQIGSGESEGDERWYAWSVMFDPSFPTTDAWQVVTQWHAEGADGSPPVAFYVVGDELTLQTNPHDGDAEPEGPAIVHWSSPLDRGEWHHLRLRVRWSGDDDTGELELWADGELVLPTVRTRTLYPGHEAYFKQGYYRQSGEPQTGVVYYDAFRASEVVPSA
jgi:hypothetical protein